MACHGLAHAQSAPANPAPESAKSGPERPASGGPERVEEAAFPLQYLEAPHAQPNEKAGPTYYLKDKNGTLVPVPGFPLETFEELLRQKYRPEQTPRYSLQTVMVSGNVKGPHAELTVQFRFLIRDENWVRIPLGFDQAVLRGQARYRGPGQQFLHFESKGEGYVCWVRGGVGQEHELSLDLLVPLIRVGDETRLRFFAPRATTSQLKLTVPGTGVVAEVSEGATLVPAEPAPEGATAIAALGIGGDFALAWRPAAGRAARTPPVLEAGASLLAKIEAQEIDLEGKLTVRSFGGTFDSFRVRLPKGAALLPSSPSGYTIEPASSTGTDGRKVVEIRFPKRVSGPVEVQVNSRLTYPATDTTGWYELGGYEVVEAARGSGHLALAASTPWHVLVGTPRGARQIDELPESLRRERSIAGFEFFEQSFSIPIRALPRKTQVSVEPEYLLLVDADQVTLRAKLRYTVRNAEISALDVELPQWQIDAVEPESVVAPVGEPNASGALSIPLAQRSMGEIKFEIRAHRKIPPNTRSLSLELPRPRADSQAPANVVVLPADNVELTPTSEATVGLVRQPTAPPLELPARQQAPLFYRDRGDSQAVFAAGFRIQPQRITVGASAQVAVDEQKAQIEQKLSYTVAYRPIDSLTLDVPRELAGAEQLEVLLDGKPATLSDVPDPEDQPSRDGPVRKHLVLRSEHIGPCELVLRYAVAIPRLQPKTSVSSAIPFPLPIEGQLTGQRVMVTSKEGLRVEPREGPWTASDVITSPSPSFRGTQLAATRRTDTLMLGINLEDQKLLGTTVVSRAWVQTWLARSFRQDRAVFRLTSNQKSVELIVPAGVNLSEVELWLDEKRITGQATPEGLFLIALPGDGATRSHRVEALYRFPAPRPDPGLLAMELPRLGREVAVHRFYWQLVLPRNEHVILAPDVFTSEFAWGWNGLFWGRQPLLEQPQLETWGAARHLTDVSGETNRYLFSALGTVSRCEVRTAMRPQIVLVASGIALVVGLLLIYIPPMRHPAMLLTGAVVLCSAAILYPEPVLLLAQAAGLGVVLSVLSAVLYRSLARRRQAIVPREMASSILERASTHAAVHVAGGEAPTEIASPSPSSTSPPQT